MADHRRTLRALGWREPEVLSEVGRRIRATWARCLSPYSSGTAHSHFSTFESEVRQASGMGALRSFG